MFPDFNLALDNASFPRKWGFSHQLFTGTVFFVSSSLEFLAPIVYRIGSFLLAAPLSTVAVSCAPAATRGREEP